MTAEAGNCLLTEAAGPAGPIDQIGEREKGRWMPCTGLWPVLKSQPKLAGPVQNRTKH